MADEPVTQPAPVPVAAPAPVAPPVDPVAEAKAARRAARAAARAERVGPPREQFVVTTPIPLEGGDVQPGALVALTETGAKTWAASIRPASDLDRSAGPPPRPIG